MKRRPGAVDFSQRVLDRPDRSDGSNVERHLHELRVRLVEVRSISHDSGHFAVDVLQHQVVLRLLDSQSSRHIADDEVVTQLFLLVKDHRGR